jgi:hypothetical protein
LEIRIATSPIIEGWITEAVSALNATTPLVNATRRVHYSVETIDDTQVWLDDSREWTPENHPQAWIPAASSSVQFASENRLPFVVVQPSVARTMMIWGGFSSYVNDMTNDGAAPLDWEVVAEEAPNARLAFYHPVRTISGLSVLLSGAAAFHDTPVLTGTEVNDQDFREWIEPVLEAVPNFNTLGAVAETLAARGPSNGQLGFLAEAEWLQNLRGFLAEESDPVVLSYPQYTVIFEFPLARWNGSTTATIADEAAAVDLLGNWLTDAGQQSRAENFGLRPVQDDPAAGLFAEGEGYGALISPVVQAVEPPSRNDLRQLVGWVGTIVR